MKTRDDLLEWVYQALGPDWYVVVTEEIKTRIIGRTRSTEVSFVLFVMFEPHSDIYERIEGATIHVIASTFKHAAWLKLQRALEKWRAGPEKRAIAGPKQLVIESHQPKIGRQQLALPHKQLALTHTQLFGDDDQ